MQYILPVTQMNATQNGQSDLLGPSEGALDLFTELLQISQANIEQEPEQLQNNEIDLLSEEEQVLEDVFLDKDIVAAVQAQVMLPENANISKIVPNIEKNIELLNSNQQEYSNSDELEKLLEIQTSQLKTANQKVFAETNISNVQNTVSNLAAVVKENINPLANQYIYKANEVGRELANAPSETVDFRNPVENSFVAEEVVPEISTNKAINNIVADNISQPKNFVNIIQESNIQRKIVDTDITLKENATKPQKAEFDLVIDVNDQSTYQHISKERVFNTLEKTNETTSNFEVNIAPQEFPIDEVQQKIQESSNVQAEFSEMLAEDAPSVMDQVHFAVSNSTKGDAKIHLKLFPQELGTVEIDIQKSNKDMKIAFKVENSETLELIKADANSLEKILSYSGIKSENTQFTFDLIQSEQQLASQMHNSDSQSEREYQNAKAEFDNNIEQQDQERTVSYYINNNEGVDIRV